MKYWRDRKFPPLTSEDVQLNESIIGQVQRHTVGLVIAVSPEERHEWSGVLIRFRTKSLILTCKHELSHINRGRSEILFWPDTARVPTKKSELPAVRRRLPIYYAKPADLGRRRIWESNEAGLSAIEFPETLLEGEGARLYEPESAAVNSPVGALILATGYADELKDRSLNPVTGQKHHTFAIRNEQRIFLDCQVEPSLEGFDPTIRFLMEEIPDPSGKEDLSSTRGMSGCGIWTAYMANHEGALIPTPVLLGIQDAQYSKGRLTKAVRFSVIWDLLNAVAT